MKQSLIINAYQVLENHSNDKNLSPKGKWVVFKMRNTMRPHYDFFSQQQREYFDKYNGEVIDDNKIHFKSTEKAQAFTKDLNEILDMEVELENFKKETLLFTDIPDITVNEMEQLQDFIEFELGE